MFVLAETNNRSRAPYTLRKVLGCLWLHWIATLPNGLFSKPHSITPTQTHTHTHPIVLGLKERCLLQTKRPLSPAVCADPSAASTRRRCRSRFEPGDWIAGALGRTVMAPCSPCGLLPHVVGRVHLWRLHLVLSVALEIRCRFSLKNVQLRECLHYCQVRTQAQSDRGHVAPLTRSGYRENRAQ